MIFSEVISHYTVHLSGCICCSWILGASYSAILFIDVTIEVKMGLFVHYEFANELVFETQFQNTATTLNASLCIIWF